MAVVAFVGFGELGAALAGAMAATGRHQLRAYLRRLPAQGSSCQRRLAESRVPAATDLDQVVAGADAVLITVPGEACLEVAARCAPHLTEGVIYVDMASAPPD